MIHRTKEGQVLRLGINWNVRLDFLKRKELYVALLIPYWISKGIYFDIDDLFNKGWRLHVLALRFKFTISVLYQGIGKPK